MTQGWQERALEDMQSERAGLVSRVGRLDVAIEALRNLIGHEDPAAPASSTPAARVASPRPSARKSGAVRQQILDALRKGHLSPASLAEAIGMETSATMYHVKKLETAGSVVLTGASNFNRRVALPSSGSAKEAP